MSLPLKRTAAAVAGAALAATALAAGSGTAQEPPAPTELELVATDRDTRSAFVDAPPRRREGPGDMFTIEGRLRGGAGRVVATFVQTSGARAQGGGTFVLPNGRIMFAGTLSGSSRVNEMAVIGGTGAYANAGGTMTATESRTATSFRITLAP